jgi:hypothetical protein
MPVAARGVAARRDGRTKRWPRGRGSIRGKSLAKFSRRDCRTSKHPRGETATARRYSDRARVNVSRAVAAPHGEMGSPPDCTAAWPHGHAARRPRGGCMTTGRAQAVHGAARRTARQPRGAGRWLCGETATRGVGRAAAARRKAAWRDGRRRAMAVWRDDRTARWPRGNQSSGRGSIRGRSLAEFRDSGDCGVPGLQPRSCRTYKRIQSTVKFECECCARGAGQATSFGGSDWRHRVDWSSSLLLHYHIHVQVLSSRS